ncbi:DUF721 domain-containing protein [Gloeothece verrucosa]|uniref:RNA-binding protein containing Zn ribbon n=1 Tax=Gloeothece verrucosa (strain PCC 7822) TaxID=497965 RepID=E0UEF6_GLOV7|nr:DciA family protein [Gloeothece verrucosa]ADN15402.1 protein of unknown function DUF721 [Gloeothece verrucosa PCC 7822]
MSFESISEIINFVEQQPGWEMVRLYRHIQRCWSTLVGSRVAAHTRPLFVQRQVLWVATSSSAWAQNLSLMRYSLLKKLNAQLSEPLSDIRFSPASWYNSLQIDDGEDQAQANLREQHPSFVSREQDLIKPEQSPSLSDDPQAVFEHWVQKMQQNHQHLPLCPSCHCPTPRGELQRWSVCSYCATKEWTT